MLETGQLSKAIKAKKANEGQLRPASPYLQISLVFSLFNVKSSINMNITLKVLEIFTFTTLKLNFVEYVDV